MQIYTPEVEEFEPSEEVKASEQMHGPTTKRTETIVEYLKPAAFDRKPAADCFADRSEIKEDELKENEIDEEDSLQEKDTDVHHDGRDREYPSRDARD